ncbi:putative type II/III system pilus formation protein [Breoghania corrubedonensis]|uniref:Putative type II/III system pilus formation protein n=1 Tax=Breoghania corrubedonensis TaxID=665038 RepID=A0A2T5VG26_9HYPH|nr:pilus assembly protein N-terminal domain-containing protein [Breoghania corrubedonensis]PTW62705.1 putative type II/III system pilus formation protein [Breoghania corrubedonensis]
MRCTHLRILPVVGILLAAALPAWADGVVSVVTDRAKVFRIDEPADTIIVGNPAIADVTMHDRTTLVITGKSFGSTNLVILNKAGDPIIDEVIQVEPQASSVVTVTRAGASYSYGCSPICKPYPSIGDSKEFFDDTYAQIGKRRALSEGGGAAADQ